MKTCDRHSMSVVVIYRDGRDCPLCDAEERLEKAEALSNKFELEAIRLQEELDAIDARITGHAS